MHSHTLPARLVALLFVLVLTSGEAFAQHDVTIRAIASSAHLTGREHEGYYGGLSASMDLTGRLYVVGRAGYLRSVQLDWFSSPLPYGIDDWRDRHHIMVDMGVGFDVLRFKTGAFQHRFGPSMSLSIRRRSEEIVGRTYHPAFFNGMPQEYVDALLAACGSSKNGVNLYCMTYDDGPDGWGIDGQYAVETDSGVAQDIGGVLGFNYRTLFRHVEIGAEVGLYRYLDQGRKWGGSHTFYWGLTAGYRF